MNTFIHVMYWNIFSCLWAPSFTYFWWIGDLTLNIIQFIILISILVIFGAWLRHFCLSYLKDTLFMKAWWFSVLCWCQKTPDFFFFFCLWCEKERLSYWFFLYECPINTAPLLKNLLYFVKSPLLSSRWPNTYGSVCDF